MKKILSFLIVLAICQSSFAQGGWIRNNTSYGNRQYRIAIDSTLFFPTGCGSAVLRGTDLKQAAVYFDSCAAVMYVYNPSTKAWSNVAAGAGVTEVRVEGFVGGAAPVVTGTMQTVTGIYAGSDTISSVAFSNKRVSVIRGFQIVPGINPGDGSIYYQKDVVSNNIILNVGLQSGEYVKIETF